jgi:hypothetical protein
VETEVGNEETADDPAKRTRNKGHDDGWDDSQSAIDHHPGRHNAAKGFDTAHRKVYFS